MCDKRATNLKPFKTVDELIPVLESRGVATTERERAYLQREGYYSVINGYKNILIDLKATEEAGDDRYRVGTTFDHFIMIFDFDRSLRKATFSRLVPVEVMARNAIVNAFCHAHPQPDAYLDESSYCGADHYYKTVRVRAKGNRMLIQAAHQEYEKNLKVLRGKLKQVYKNKWNQGCIRHYREKYGQVPLWVLANMLTFGNMSNFYTLQRRGEQSQVCKVLTEERGEGGRIKVDRLRSSLSTLVKFRNICAHDDRLYCARTGPQAYGGSSYADMLRALRVVAGASTVDALTAEVATMAKEIVTETWVRREVLSSMRLKYDASGRLVPRGGW